MSLLNIENNYNHKKGVKRDRQERILRKRSKMGLRDIEATLPPGFRFYPSDEELVCHYLYKKIVNEESVKGTLVEIDLHTCEPWQLPEGAKLNTSEWYFFSFRDRKYATGYRTNRATTSGYWKATGKDRVILDPNTREVVGMRKTLVFYRNRAPNGIKTGWIMHEFRLETPHMPPKEDWVLCRVFHKSKGSEENINNNISMTTTNYHQQMMMISSQHQMIDQSCLSTSPPLITSSVSTSPPPSLSSTIDHYHHQQQQHNTNACQHANSSLFIPSSNPTTTTTTNKNHHHHHHHNQQVGLLSSISFSDLINTGGAKNDDDFGFLWDMDLENDDHSSAIILPHHPHHQLDDDMRFEDDGAAIFL